MNRGTPVAIILGIEHFAAKKLAEELAKKDIVVVGMGENVAGLEEITNYHFAEDEEEIENASYVFDFLGDGKLWSKIKSIDVKLSVICVNRDDVAQVGKKIEKFDGNWRLIIASGVYGPGMEDRGFLTMALKQAVLNKNLVLPATNLVYRLLAVEDLVEVVLRASFLSGTEKDVFLAVGNEINSEEVARVLIDEAKMTRNKVIQSEITIEKYNEEEIEATRKRLRWEPKVDFKKGVKETLQYFFSKIDEESRSNKRRTGENISQKSEVKRESPVFEVMVEDESGEQNAHIIQGKEDRVEEVKKVEEKINEDEKEQVISEPIKIEEIEEDGVEEEDGEIEEMDDEEEVEAAKIESVEVSPLPPREVSVDVQEQRKDFGETRERKKENNGWKGLVGLSLVIMVVILIIPLNWIRWGALAVNQLKNGKKLIAAKQYSQATLEIERAKNEMVAINDNIDSLGLNKIGWIRNLQELSRAGEEVAVLEGKIVGLAATSDELNKAMFGEKEIDFSQKMEAMKNILMETESDIGVLQARLKGNWSWLPKRYMADLADSSKQLEEIRNTIGLTNRSWGMLPEFLGLDGKRREYLVLFQNETELRPNGGFIGSYGLLSFQGGKLLNFEIKDIYEADGQLKGHVEPPAEIKNILGEANFYMRDANFSASFPDSVKDLEWFLEKETGKKVDGVVGMDLEVAKEAVAVVGEVYVPDFKEKINKDNLYEQAEYYAETKFFPGSKQKAGFLGSLGKQLFEEIKSLSPDKQVRLYQVMISLLERNEIQMVLNNNGAAKVLANMGWDGAIYQGKCNQTPETKGSRCLADYLYIVEANLGVNKANYFIYRNIEVLADIQNDSVNRKVKINYENTAKSNNWPAGDYKNYMRIYLPAEVMVGEVSVTDEANSKKIYGRDELKITNIYGKTEVGFLVTVPFSKKRTVEVNYSSRVDLSQTGQFSYLNYIQRQPGSGDTGLVMLVNMPADFRANQVQPEASLVGGKLLFNTKLDRDLKMGVEMGR